MLSEFSVIRLALALSGASRATMMPGPWLLVMTLRRTVLPSNSLSTNGGLGIDLIIAGGNASLGDGVNLNDGLTDPTTGNNGLDYPIIESAQILGPNLVLNGFARNFR